jgi:hypothetical protein
VAGLGPQALWTGVTAVAVIYTVLTAVAAIGFTPHIWDPRWEPLPLDPPTRPPTPW